MNTIGMIPGRDPGASYSREGIRTVTVKLDSFKEAQSLKENGQSIDGIGDDFKRGVDTLVNVSCSMNINRFNDNRKNGDEDPRIGVVSLGDPKNPVEGPMHSIRESNGKTLYQKNLEENVELKYDLSTGKHQSFNTNLVQFNTYDVNDSPSPSNTSEVHQRYFIDNDGRSHYLYGEAHPDDSNSISSVINKKTEVIVDDHKGTVAIIINDSAAPTGL